MKIEKNTEKRKCHTFWVYTSSYAASMLYFAIIHRVYIMKERNGNPANCVEYLPGYFSMRNVPNSSQELGRSKLAKKSIVAGLYTVAT